MKKIYAFFIVMIFFMKLSIGQRIYQEDAINEYKLNFSPITKRYKKFIKYPQEFPEKLDSNAIYLITYKEDESKDSSIIFIRFFSNNRCFVSERYLSIPNIEEIKKMEYGRHCMYEYKKSKKHEEVVIEHYDTLHFPRQFFYKYFRLEGGNLNYYKKNTESGFCFDADKVNYLAIKMNLNYFPHR